MDTHGDQRLPMASTAKMMTAILVIEKGNLNQMVTVKEDAIEEAINKSSGKLSPNNVTRVARLIVSDSGSSGLQAALEQLPIYQHHAQSN